MDVAIMNTLAVTMRDGDLGVVDDATIAIADGEITYVGPDEGFDAEPDREIDGEGTLTCPGFVDVHAHTGLTLLRGGAQDVPEIEWMTHALGPLAEATTPADRIAGARLGVLEAVCSGVTTVGEYAADVARLVDEVYLPMGVRVVATETINAVDADGADREPDEAYPLDDDLAEAGLERNETLFEEFADEPIVSAMYGPQAVDMVPQWLLETVRDRAADRERDVHIHVAQGDRERRQIEARYGTGESTVDVLDALGLTTERLLAVHLHGASATERGRLADADVRMAANPSSIAAIDGIVPPVVEYREQGGVVGIGTDQAPGPGGHDFLRELRTAALLAKTDRRDPTAFPAWESLRVATIEGARALGIDDRVGSLSVGKRADVIVCDLTHPSVAPTVRTPLETAIPNLIYGANAGIVDHVFVDGSPIVDGGELVTADRESIVADAQRRAERTFDAAADEWRAAGSRLVDRTDE